MTLIPAYTQLESIGYRYVLDALSTSSPYGAAIAKKPPIFSPCEKDALVRELANVDKALKTLDDNEALYSKLERLLMPLKDIRRSVMLLDDSALSEIEIFELKRFLIQTELIAPVYDQINAVAQFYDMEIFALSKPLDVLDLDNTRSATFYISDAKYPMLKDARKHKREIEQKLRNATDSAERDALKSERSAAAAREDDEEKRIRYELTKALVPYKKNILEVIDAIGKLDFTVARAKLAKKYGGVLPEITEERVSLTDMINPRIADALSENSRSFTPVSIELEKGSTVITGANMGGKSVALKTIALNVMLTVSGILPFAKEARIPLFDSIHIISEDLENVDRGLSSFGAEIVRFNEVMHERGKFSLILLDEFARGTNPEEGARIVRAVTRYLGRQDAISVLTTHYDDVARLARAHYEVVGLKDMNMEEVKMRIEKSGGDGVSVIAEFMNYGLRPVRDDSDCPRDALNICRILSLDDEILHDIESEMRL